MIANSDYHLSKIQRTHIKVKAMNKPPFFSNKRRLQFALIAGFFLAISLYGCLQNYGRFTRDAQVNDAFISGIVPPDLNYYYAGRDNMPYAIMGIDPNYKNTSKLWIAFEPLPEQLRKMTSNIYGKSHADPYGFNIMSPDGNIVGIWFSGLHFPSVKVDQQKKTIEVLYKNPEIYRDS